jgi:hypothetical protein
LDWGNSTLPSGTIFKHYQIQVDVNSDFSSPLIDATTANGDRADSKFTPVSDLAPNTIYYWRVRAFNTNDHVSSWSAVRFFRTALLPPTLLVPENLNTLDTLRPLFEWEEVPGAAGYTIQISTSPSFGTLLVNVNRTVPGYIPSKDLPANRTIYWRVRANGANGPSLWSTFWFKTP